MKHINHFAYLVLILLSFYSCDSRDPDRDAQIPIERQEEYDRDQVFEKRSIENPYPDDEFELDRDVFDVDDFKMDE